MKNIAKLAKNLGEEKVETVIIPEIQKLSKDNTWRVRLSIIEFCPEMASFLSAQKFKEHIEPLIKLWLEDSVH